MRFRINLTPGFIRRRRKIKQIDAKLAIVEHESAIRPKLKNEYKPLETDPNQFTMHHMKETVIVKAGSQSPVDMLAARIAYRIMKEGLCKVSKTEMAGELDRYVIEVTISKQKP